jgi:N-formylglutamate deformylase
MTSDANDLPDDAFLNAFLACDLPPGAFNHRNHLRVAWLHLRRFPLDEAIERTCVGIARYAAHLNATDRYHRTLTEALIRLMAHAGASDTSLSFPEFLEHAPALTGDCRALIARHYSPELLSRPEARYNFLAPDRHPLPT